MVHDAQMKEIVVTNDKSFVVKCRKKFGWWWNRPIQEDTCEYEWKRVLYKITEMEAMSV